MNNEYAKKRYHTKRVKWIETLGGCCVRCGSVKNLEFDHIDASTKKFGIGANWSQSEDKIIAELKKCQLLCTECHKQKTKEAWDYNCNQVDHGTYWMYRKYKCRCELCVVANSVYIKESKLRAKQRKEKTI